MKPSAKWRNTSHRIKRPAYEKPLLIFSGATSEFGMSSRSLWSLLPHENQTADRKGHGRPIGASIDETLEGSPMRSLAWVWFVSRKKWITNYVIALNSWLLNATIFFTFWKAENHGGKSANLADRVLSAKFQLFSSISLIRAMGRVKHWLLTL